MKRMKTNVGLLLSLIVVQGYLLPINAQNIEYNMEFTPSNRAAGLSMEKNLLFYADQRFQVTRQGSAVLHHDRLFDGKLIPSYTSVSPSISNPTVITIEGLPYSHIQAGAWVGWTTRYLPSSHFKIEAFNEYNGASNWVVISEQMNYNRSSFMIKMPFGAFTKLRYTFYEGSGPSGLLGVSELFYLLPEYVKAYDHLMVQYAPNGNVGIGTDTPSQKLEVNGSVRSKEVIVEEGNWPDYVFDPNYELMPLQELEAYIKENNHLPEVPTAKEVKENGIAVGAINTLVMKKIEELTLYLIEENKRLLEHELKYEARILKLEKELQQLKGLLNKSGK